MNFIVLFIFLSVAWGCSAPEQKGDNIPEQSATIECPEPLDTINVAPTNVTKKTAIPKGAQRIIDAYPDFNLKYENNKIVFPDGFAVVYDDGIEKTFVERLDNSDIEDCFAILYHQGPGEPPYQADGGRSRSDAFF